MGFMERLFGKKQQPIDLRSALEQQANAGVNANANAVEKLIALEVERDSEVTTNRIKRNVINKQLQDRKANLEAAIQLDKINVQVVNRIESLQNETMDLALEYEETDEAYAQMMVKVNAFKATKPGRQTQANNFAGLSIKELADMAKAKKSAVATPVVLVSAAPLQSGVAPTTVTTPTSGSTPLSVPSNTGSGAVTPGVTAPANKVPGYGVLFPNPDEAPDLGNAPATKGN